MSHYAFVSRSFIALLSYRLFVILCYQITAVVVGWQIYQLTGDALALGLIGLAEVIPYFASALFAGYAVDRYNKRRLGLMACSLLVLMTSALLVYSLLPSEQVQSWGTIPIYAAIALSGFARAAGRAQ
jgi:MFS family permease